MKKILFIVIIAVVAFGVRVSAQDLSSDNHFVVGARAGSTSLICAIHLMMWIFTSIIMGCASKLVFSRSMIIFGKDWRFVRMCCIPLVVCGSLGRISTTNSVPIILIFAFPLPTLF